VLIAASTILLIVQSRKAPERTETARAATFGCGAGPGLVGLACGARF
jgi:hypothetical protein